jgi:hypothetical protein
VIRVTGRIFVSAEGATLAEAIAAYRAKYEGSPDEWEVTEATQGETEQDGGSIVAWCEGCGKPICDDEKSYSDGEYDECEACHGEP